MAATQLWFVAATGRGTALKAHVYGPYNSVAEFKAANPGNPLETFTLVGNKNGYPSQKAAEAEAASYNSGSVTQRVTQAGGNVGTLPSIPGLSTIGQFLSLITSREFMVRAFKVVGGTAAILIGLVEIAKPGQILSKIPVIPV